MPRPRDSPKCLPCRKSGFSCQQENLEGPDILYMSEESNFEAEDTCVLQLQQENHRQTLQDHNQAHSSAHSNRSNCTSTTTHKCDSEHGSTLHPQSIQLRPLPDRSCPAVSRSDLEHCRQALRKTFRDCDKAEFRLVTCLISCILNCARWFSRHEILAATTLSDPERISKKPMSASQRSQEDHWLRKCNHIVMETIEGNMMFRSRAMESFLRSFRIKGIDTSHRTLALICRNQTALDKRFQKDVMSLDDRTDVFRATQVLSPYVSSFGNHHFKIASLTSIIPVAEEEDTALSKTKDSVSGTSDDFEIIQHGTNKLSLSEEGNGWVLLSPTGATASSIDHH